MHQPPATQCFQKPSLSFWASQCRTLCRPAWYLRILALAICASSIFLSPFLRDAFFEMSNCSMAFLRAGSRSSCRTDDSSIACLGWLRSKIYFRFKPSRRRDAQRTRTGRQRGWCQASWDVLGIHCHVTIGQHCNIDVRSDHLV